jgi:hypothetical protein
MLYLILKQYTRAHGDINKITYKIISLLFLFKHDAQAMDVVINLHQYVEGNDDHDVNDMNVAGAGDHDRNPRIEYDRKVAVNNGDGAGDDDADDDEKEEPDDPPFYQLFHLDVEGPIANNNDANNNDAIDNTRCDKSVQRILMMTPLLKNQFIFNNVATYQLIIVMMIQMMSQQLIINGDALLLP